MKAFFPRLNRPVAFVLVVFGCAVLLAASAALVTTVHWRHAMMSTNPAPPNGTPGSEQPGTIGLARPHSPLPAR